MLKARRAAPGRRGGARRGGRGGARPPLARGRDLGGRGSAVAGLGRSPLADLDSQGRWQRKRHTPRIREDELATESEAPAGLDPERLERRDAALAQVVKFGDPVLRSVASPVTEFDDALAAEVERMSDLMQEGMGVGLAATQLGILRRMLVFQAGPDAPPTALINPEIEWSSEQDWSPPRRAASACPGIVVDVERPLHVTGQRPSTRAASRS